MLEADELVYAQARLQARHGARVSDAQWRTLAATVDVAQYLHAARETSLRRWVQRIDASASVHVIEQRLRAEWHDYVAEVARWQPSAWKDALEWTSHLVDLPVLAHLLRGEAAPAWMRADPAYAAWAQPTLEERRRALVATPLAPLAAAGDGRPVFELWLEEWRRRWPRASLSQTAPLEALVALCSRHRAEMLVAAAPMSRDLRNRLGDHALRLFRWHTESPAAACAHLLMTALDVERLRAGLVRRALQAEIGALVS